MITEPTTLFAFLAGVLALVFWLSTLKPLEKLFTYLPPVIWAYFIPMLCTTLGITPASSALYSWMSTYLLPLALFLLMISVDLPAIAKLGKIALLMMLAGTIGIVIGGPIAYGALGWALPPDAWKGLAALSGSWIGGTANMVFIADNVGTSELGPVIVVDTVVGYGWMGVLLFFAAYQARFDRWNRADTTAIERLNARMEEFEAVRKPASLADLGMILGIGFIAVILSIAAGGALPEVFLPGFGDMDAVRIITHGTWGILVVVTGGLLLSFTPISRLEAPGASRVGYLALYLLLTSIGAKADLAAVQEYPMYLVVGLVWISIHVLMLLGAARLLRAPLFFVATGSMANIGGAASAPVVAGVYSPGLTSVGLLMAVAGYILGIYAALVCRYLLEMVNGMIF